ncbi:hypothetical protein HOK51_07565 [Candidatus Woesearchaeota archaeon]|jgi:hypothetical protein|nr:hypothetical protein [Candidatus Woesearchaeota archaeon]MBT7367372.1 hypothetical protein [Candidatus Woesearchaeota archaeon]
MTDKTNTKITGIRKTKNLDELAKFAASEDSDFIQTLLSFDSKVGEEFKSKSTTGISGNIFYSIPKKIITSDNDENTIASALFCFNLSTKKTNLVYTSDSIITAIQWVPEKGLFLTEVKSLIQLTDANLKMNKKEVFSKTAPITALTYFPTQKILLDGSAEGLFFNIFSSGDTWSTRRDDEVSPPIYDLNYFPSRGVFYSSNDGIYCAVDHDLKFVREKIYSIGRSKFECFPNHCFFAAYKNMIHPFNFLKPMQGPFGELERNSTITDLLYVPNLGILDCGYYKQIRLCVDHNCKPTDQEILTTDNTIIAMEYVSDISK